MIIKLTNFCVSHENRLKLERVCKVPKDIPYKYMMYIAASNHTY